MKSYYNRRNGKPRSPQKQQGPGSRVFESTSAKGKIRGTTQQLVERYLQFAEEARLANDRVALEASCNRPSIMFAWANLRVMWRTSL